MIIRYDVSGPINSDFKTFTVPVPFYGLHHPNRSERRGKIFTARCTRVFRKGRQGDNPSHPPRPSRLASHISHLTSHPNEYERIFKNIGDSGRQSIRETAVALRNPFGLLEKNLFKL